MDATTFRNTTQEILQNLENQGEVSNKLADLVQAFDEEAGARITAEKQVTDLTENNRRLQEKNMELFLRATQPISTTQVVKQEERSSEETGDAIDRLFADGRINWQRSN